MLRKKKSLMLAGLFLILLASGLFIPQQDAAAQKIRIAVMPFKIGNIKNWWGWGWDPGEGISDMLVTELVNSGRFSVVERERLDEVLQEQNLAREGVINAATAARIGRILGVQLFVFGTVTQFSLDSKIIKLPVVGELAEWRARCTLNARLVNVETSEIMAAVTGQGAKSQSNIKLSERWGDLSGFAFGSSRFAEHILGKATTKAVEDVAEGIGEKTAGLTPVVVTPEVTPTPTPTVTPEVVTPTITPEVKPRVIEGLVAKVSDDGIGGEIVINLGSQDAVKVGDVFNVRKIIEIIKDPETDKVILRRTEKIAEMKISEVYEQAAIGKITLRGIKPIEVGDLVDAVTERVPTAPPQVEVTEIKPPVITVPLVMEREIIVNNVFKIKDAWKFTLASYQILEDRDIQFNLIVENLQDKPEDIRFLPDDSRTYLLDNLSKKYFSPTLSVEPRTPISFIQHMPVTISLTFPSLQEGVDIVVLYVMINARGVSTPGLAQGWARLYFGPIKLE